jgi:hypothetical protein
MLETLWETGLYKTWGKESRIKTKIIWPEIELENWK